MKLAKKKKAVCSIKFKKSNPERQTVRKDHASMQNLQIDTPEKVCGPLRYKCKQCGKCFPTPSKFRRHSYIHSGLRPFQCTFCSWSSSQASHLRKHCKNVHLDKFASELNDEQLENNISIMLDELKQRNMDNSFIDKFVSNTQIK